MSTRLIGITVAAEEVSIVVLIKNAEEDFTMEEQTRMQLQSGSRPAAYQTFYDQFSDFVRQRRITLVCVKASAINPGGTKVSHLEAAELRGVAQAAAAAAGAEVRAVKRAVVSRKLKSQNKRDVDNYIADDAHWKEIGLANLKKGFREAAFTAIAASE